MSDLDTEPSPNLIDRSVKRLFRDQPQALLRLLGLQPDASTSIRFEDCNLNFPEFRADHVLVVDLRFDAGDTVSLALYFEYQLRPDPGLLPN